MSEAQVRYLLAELERTGGQIVWGVDLRPLARSWLAQRAALEGVLKSFEAHCHLKEPKPEDEMDEYDFAMRPLWEAARAALEER